MLPRHLAEHRLVLTGNGGNEVVNTTLKQETTSIELLLTTVVTRESTWECNNVIIGYSAQVCTCVNSRQLLKPVSIIAHMMEVLCIARITLCNTKTV